MKKKLPTILICILFFSPLLWRGTGGEAFSQSRKEWLQTADDAFKQEDYSTASHYYLKVLEGPADGENISYPYEVNEVLLPKKKTPTTTVDTSKGLKPVVTREEVSPGTQRIIHNLAESYRQIHDYPNTEKWFEKSASRNPKAYPDERYWYANSLMENGKYEKATEEFEKYMLTNTDKNSSLYKSAQKKSLSCDFFAGTSLSLNPLSILFFRKCLRSIA